MRKVVLKISMSVDGFVATKSGGLEWMFPSLSEDARNWIVQTLWQAGTHIMGRATYLAMAQYWPFSAEVFAAPMNQIPKVVFSSSLKKADWQESRVSSGDLVEEIAKLKQEPGKDIVAHGGASFLQSLSSQRLVDEYRLIVHPVVLGSGLPLFVSQMDLTLVTAIPFSGGAVGYVYQPT